MANRNKIRPKVVKKPPDARCICCDNHYPLTSSHLIGQGILNRLPDPHRKFFDYDSFNVVIMCKNCHDAYQDGLLTKRQYQKIFGQLHHALLELWVHLMDIDPTNEGLLLLREFINTQDYERNTEKRKRHHAKAKQSQGRKEGDKVDKST